MAKIFILGADGMLGHIVYEALLTHHDVTGFVKKTGKHPIYRDMISLNLENRPLLKASLDVVEPDIIINCAGIIKQRTDSNPSEMRSLNEELPKFLAEWVNKNDKWLIHISTDCIYHCNGPGMYWETNVHPIAMDNYGLSKRFGEELEGNVLILRTSIVGPELPHKRKLGFFEWVKGLPNGSKVKGYRRAYWNGVTTTELAGQIAEIIRYQPGTTGLYNVAGDDIVTKYDMIKMIDGLYEKHLVIEPEYETVCNRTLCGLKFKEKFNTRLPSIREMLRLIRWCEDV